LLLEERAVGGPGSQELVDIRIGDLELIDEHDRPISVLELVCQADLTIHFSHVCHARGLLLALVTRRDLQIHNGKLTIMARRQDVVLRKNRSGTLQRRLLRRVDQHDWMASADQLQELIGEIAFVAERTGESREQAALARELRCRLQHECRFEDVHVTVWKRTGLQ
jgi:hypothetical protein